MQITGQHFAGSLEPCWFYHVWTIPFTSGSFNTNCIYIRGSGVNISFMHLDVYVNEWLYIC